MQCELDPAIAVEFTAEYDRSTQRYFQALPKNFDAAVPHMLLIALHGHGSDGHAYIINPRPECAGVRNVAARHGMIFLSPDYRGNSWMGPAAEADLVQMIGDCKKKFKVSKVILTGASMGGTSVLIFAALHPELLDGVSSLNGIASMMDYDIANYGIAEAIKLSYGGKPEETWAQYRKRNPGEFRKRSPLFHAEAFTMPVSIGVGCKDELVPPPTTIELGEKIKKTNPNTLLLVRPEIGHETNYEDTVAALEFVIERATKTPLTV